MRMLQDSRLRGCRKKLSCVPRRRTESAGRVIKMALVAIILAVQVTRNFLHSGGNLLYSHEYNRHPGQMLGTSLAKSGKAANRR